MTKEVFMAELIRIDRNGTKYYKGMVECDRCNGLGLYATGVCNGRLVITPVDNGICHKCGGARKVMRTWKEYTPEYEAKLEAKRAAKRAEQDRIWAEEEEKREAERKAREAEEEAARKAEEERIKAEKAISQYVGTEGERIDMQATYIGSASFDVPSFSGFGMDTMYIHMFKDGNGNKLVWKTGKGIGLERETQVSLRGTIKAHSEYKDEKQTVLTRCKIS